MPEGQLAHTRLVLENTAWWFRGRRLRANGEGFFRISLTVPDERLAEAVERLRGSLGG